ncbi:hypothetical protein GS399_09335 [Pedobacter sp. HMF7647]|uniref:DUF2541 family protein n=1 Tax=Hufsiella arboris TaxID=2695275 RepID=A0A7K1Y9S4_9SPHI|nr:hypothetical protein [Hufsiella arboris]MXV51170.1 hypothetical protein [Hufsiella arboris]
MKKFIVFVALIAFSSALSAQQVRRGKAGTPGTWRVIGTTQARFTADHDGIVVTPPFDNFRRVQIKVTDAPLRLVKMQVTYGDGAPDILPVALDIPQGGTSRAIDLRGVGTRHIRRIDFWYDTRGVARGRANVTVLGMK